MENLQISNLNFHKAEDLSKIISIFKFFKKTQK